MFYKSNVTKVLPLCSFYNVPFLKMMDILKPIDFDQNPLEVILLHQKLLGKAYKL